VQPKNGKKKLASPIDAASFHLSFEYLRIEFRARQKRQHDRAKAG
jgi:hypothetical protein